MLEPTGILQPEPGHVLPNCNPTMYGLVVVDAQGRRLPVDGVTSNDVIPASLRWSPSGRGLLSVSNSAGGPRLARFELAGGSLRLLPGFEGTLASPRGVHWTPDDRLLVQSRENGRLDWFLLNGPVHTNLTAAMTRPPSVFVVIGEEQSLAAVADGRIWLMRQGAELEPIRKFPFRTKPRPHRLARRQNTAPIACGHGGPGLLRGRHSARHAPASFLARPGS
ncbi:MAG: hypothetical protein QM757_23970 [Paludibaculum sp.]